MLLNDAELRVLGCLVEKEMTTPDYYPLSQSALIAACNQKNNRDPVVEYGDSDVLGALDGLRDRGLCRAVHRPGQRTVKYRHVLDDTLEVDGEQAAVLAVLMLRGPQTLGEIRTRTERYHDFESLAAVADVLGGLATRAADPLAERLGRRPGEKEPRYRHLLGGDEQADPPALEAAVQAEVPAAVPTAAPDAPDLRAKVDALRRDLDALTRRFDALAKGLGEGP